MPDRNRASPKSADDTRKELEVRPHDGPITVVLATDSFLIGDGLASLLAGVAEVEVVARAHDHEELLALVEELTPEALIVSIRSPIVTTMPTIVAARRLREEFPDMGIVVISDRGDGFALELLRGGASRIAYLLDTRLPDLDAVLDALNEVCAGQTVLDPGIVDSLVQRRDELAIDDLNPREAEILEQLAKGLSNRAIAAKLHVSTKSVEKYVSTIFRKLGLDDQDADRRVTAALAFLQAQTEPFGIQVTGGRTEEETVPLRRPTDATGLAHPGGIGPAVRRHRDEWPEPVRRELPHPEAEVALLDRAGVIVSVNAAWIAFAEANGGDPASTGVGQSYLEACAAAPGDHNAEQVAAGLRAALEGDLLVPMKVHVPCHSADTSRWFDVFISSRLADDGHCLGATVTLALSCRTTR
jgi:DNA-binding NarL/FixJ family response regulator